MIQHPPPPEDSMMTRNARLCLAVLAVLFVATVARAAAESKPAVTLDPPVGTVKDTAGTPIEGAEVLLYYNRSTWGLGNRVVEAVKTDAAGSFKFTQSLPFETLSGSDYGDFYVVYARDAKHA